MFENRRVLSVNSGPGVVYVLLDGEMLDIEKSPNQKEGSWDCPLLVEVNCPERTSIFSVGHGSREDVVLGGDQDRGSSLFLRENNEGSCN